MPEFNRSWKTWLLENFNRGCAKESLVQAMVTSGFDLETAQMIVDKRGEVDQLTETYVYDEMPLSKENVIEVGDQKVAVLVRVEKPQIVVFGNVFSNEECDEIIRRAKTRLKPSTVLDAHTGVSVPHEARTSEGASFSRCEDDFIAQLESRVASLMGVPIENGEGFHVLRYGVGAQYRPHHDYFAPEYSGSATHLASGGQRVSTLVVYLNDVEEGGGTEFPEGGISVSPKKGNAVYFRYCNQLGQIDSKSLHAGLPVIKGEKWIITKWMRQRERA